VGTIDNLKELLLTAAEKYGDRPAFDFARKKEVVSVGYNTFKSDACALGTYFFDVNIQNTKIALLGDNSYEWILSWFAAVCGGNVAVPLPGGLPAPEIKTLFDGSGAEVFVYSDTYSEIAVYLLENRSCVKHFISMGDLPSFVEMGGALIRGGDKRWLNLVIGSAAPAALLYGYETAGKAKGVALSHYELISAAAADRIGLHAQAHNETDRSVKEKYERKSALPFHKLSALTAVLSMLLCGNEIVINRSIR